MKIIYEIHNKKVVKYGFTYIDDCLDYEVIPTFK